MFGVWGVGFRMFLVQGSSSPKHELLVTAPRGNFPPMPSPGCGDLGSIREQLLDRNVQRFRGGLAFKAHRLCVSLNSRLESNKEETRFGPTTLERSNSGFFPASSLTDVYRTPSML